jgi:hypothetical protein
VASIIQRLFGDKQLFKAAFLALPKFIIWKIWFARNKTLFSKEKSTPALVASKCLGLFVEHFNSKTKRMSPQKQLNQFKASCLSADYTIPSFSGPYQFERS